MSRNYSITIGEISEIESKVLKIFINNYHNLKTASREYYPDLSPTAKNHRTVAFYFSQFKKNKWLDEEPKIIKVPSKRKSKLKKSHKYISNCKGYRANFNFYFDRSKHQQLNPVIKDLLTCFLNEELMREQIINTEGNIIDVVDKMLFFLCGAVTQMLKCFKEKGLVEKGIIRVLFDIEDFKNKDITPQNFKEVIRVKRALINEQPKEIRFTSLLAVYGFIGHKLDGKEGINLIKEFKKVNPLIDDYYKIHSQLYAHFEPSGN